MCEAGFAGAAFPPSVYPSIVGSPRGHLRSKEAVWLVLAVRFNANAVFSD